MSTEAVIKREGLKVLYGEGWTPWCPPRTRSRQEKDILGIFDCLAVKGPYQRWIQWTSLSNLAARRRKVLTWLAKHDVELQGIEIWGWNAAKQTFRVLVIDLSQKEETDAMNPAG